MPWLYCMNSQVPALHAQAGVPTLAASLMHRGGITAATVGPPHTAGVTGEEQQFTHSTASPQLQFAPKQASSRCYTHRTRFKSDFHVTTYNGAVFQGNDYRITFRIKEELNNRIKYYFTFLLQRDKGPTHDNTNYSFIVYK